MAENSDERANKETEEEALKMIVDAKKKLHDQKVKGKKEQPGNPISGLGRGVLSVGGGVLLGAGCLVVGTVGGLVGSVVKRDPSLAIKGPALGVAGLVAFPVAGFGHGVQLTCQGTKNVFVTDDSEYVTQEEEDLLFAEANEFLEAQTGMGSAPPPTSGGLPRAVDTELYDELGLQPDATPAQIKRAYYKMAREYHPDKNKEAGAEDKFKKISDAYQILGDEQKRADYHRYGKEVSAQENVGLTPDYLFVLMFGNGGFYNYIGHMRVMEAMKLDESLPNSKKAEILRERQKERVEFLVEKLTELLAPWGEGEEGAERGREKAREEVKKLKKTPFGVDLLRTIGYVYRHQGKRLLVKHEGVVGFRAWWIGMSEGGHMVSEKAKAQSASIDLAMKDAMRRAEEGGAGDRETMVSQLGQIWLQCSIDIQETLSQVVQKVLESKELSKKENKIRSRGLIEIGDIFSAAGGVTKADSKPKDKKEKKEKKEKKDKKEKKEEKEGEKEKEKEKEEEKGEGLVEEEKVDLGGMD